MKTITLVSLLCAALVATGCGGGGDGDGDELSRTELATKASAICAKYSKAGRDLGSPDLSDATKAEDYFTKATDLAQRQQDELEELEPVESAKADYDKLTKATADATQLLADLAAAAKARDTQKRDELVVDLRPISQAVDDGAKAIGADDCAG